MSNCRFCGLGNLTWVKNETTNKLQLQNLDNRPHKCPFSTAYYRAKYGGDDRVVKLMDDYLLLNPSGTTDKQIVADLQKLVPLSELNKRIKSKYVWRALYSPANHYLADDVVGYEGMFFICKKYHTTPHEPDMLDETVYWKPAYDKDFEDIILMLQTGTNNSQHDNYIPSKTEKVERAIKL